LGENNTWENDMFAQYQMWDWNQTGANLRSFKSGHWKLVKDFKHPGMDELYNLEIDPDERTNLINSTDPEAVKQKKNLQKKMIEKMREIDDHVDV
jgi:hypothetical protein